MSPLQGGGQAGGRQIILGRILRMDTPALLINYECVFVFGSCFLSLLSSGIAVVERAPLPPSLSPHQPVSLLSQGLNTPRGWRGEYPLGILMSGYDDGSPIPPRTKKKLVPPIGLDQIRREYEIRLVFPKESSRFGIFDTHTIRKFGLYTHVVRWPPDFRIGNFQWKKVPSLR